MKGGRPIAPGDLARYEREISALNRLRGSIVKDPELGVDKVEQLKVLLNNLVAELESHTRTLAVAQADEGSRGAPEQ